LPDQPTNHYSAALSPVEFRYARLILLTALVSVGFGFTVLFAILGPLGREVGMSELQISSIIAASSLVVFLASPRWGRLSDRWGRKRVMVIGLFGYACGNFLFASVFHLTLIGALIPLAGYLLLMLTRVMHASVMSAIMPASSAYMADITSVATRTKGMGAVGAANNFGSILGPALGWTAGGDYPAHTAVGCLGGGHHHGTVRDFLVARHPQGRA
jgi:MFS family permease